VPRSAVAQSLSLPSTSRTPVISVHARRSDDFSIAMDNRDPGPSLHRSLSVDKSDPAYFHLPTPPAQLNRSLSASRASSHGPLGQSDATSLAAGRLPSVRTSHSPAILPHARFFLPRRPAKPSPQQTPRRDLPPDGLGQRYGTSQVSLSAVGVHGAGYSDSMSSTSPAPSTFGRPSIGSYTKSDLPIVHHTSGRSEEGPRRSEEVRGERRLDDSGSDYAMAMSDGGHSSSVHGELPAPIPSSMSTHPALPGTHIARSADPQTSVGALSLAKTDTNTSTESRGPSKTATAQPSREPLIDFPLTTLPESGAVSNGSGKSIRRPSGLSSDVVSRVRNSFSSVTGSHVGGVTEKHKFFGLEKVSESIRRSSTSAPPGLQGYIVSPSGRRLRNYQLHRGSHRFFLGGRLITSRDASWPFICSLILAFTLPAAFLIFNASWLWGWKGAGGKVVVVLFAYLSLVMWSCLFNAAWRDPGIR
jgi:hypothetical protein